MRQIPQHRRRRLEVVEILPKLEIVFVLDYIHHDQILEKPTE